MIATHSAKLFNSRVKQQAVSSEIAGNIAKEIICSKTTDLARRFWASPLSAAHIKKWREIVNDLPNDSEVELSIPDIEDPKIKQILIPFDWKSDEYISTTPLPCIGMINEVYNRVSNFTIPNRFHTIQPNPASISNHGEALLMQGGRVRMLLSKLNPIVRHDWNGDCIQISARCEGMNLGSGMVSSGLPGIASIGGAVHVLERASGVDLDFCVGLRSVSIQKSVQKGSALKSKTLSNILVTDEIRGVCEIVLLIRGANSPIDDVARNIKEGTNSRNISLAIQKTLNRISGGSLFNIKVSTIYNKKPLRASYLRDVSGSGSDLDALDYALSKCAEDTYAYHKSSRGWDWKQEFGFAINHSGYAFLEAPCERNMSRNGYRHAWSEPTFSLIAQDGMSEKAWWRRFSSKECGVFWKRACS